MSGNPAQEFISDGISEELLDELSNVPALRVAARTSSFAFKGSNTDIKQIGRILSVHSVLEGSIRRDGRHIRISAQLINTADGFRIWSATYNREMTGMLTLEDDIARAITAAITHEILPRPQLLAGRPASINPDIYRKYREGLHVMAPRDAAGVTKAVALFREVTAAQPDFAAGFAALGRALINHAEDFPQQKELLPEAEAALARALALDPAAQGAALLDPLSEVDQLNVTAALIHLARFGEAVTVARAALDRMPNHTYIQAYLCTAYAHSGESEKSRAIAAQFSQAHDKYDADGCLFDIAVGQGNLDEARRINNAFVALYPNGPFGAVGLADNFAVMGDAHAAVQWMEQAYAQKDFNMFQVPFDRTIPPAVIADPGWRALTQKPLFRAWQAAHDQLAVELGAGG
jgi:TolB-like protein